MLLLLFFGHIYSPVFSYLPASWFGEHCLIKKNSLQSNAHFSTSTFVVCAQKINCQICCGKLYLDKFLRMKTTIWNEQADQKLKERKTGWGRAAHWERMIDGQQWTYWTAISLYCVLKVPVPPKTQWQDSGRPTQKSSGQRSPATHGYGHETFRNNFRSLETCLAEM